MQTSTFSESVAYERFMGRWSRLLAPRLITFAGVRDGDVVLDIGSGTGALTFAVAEAVPSVRIVGVDPSPAYVNYAQTRVSGDRVRFVVGDAQQLEFADRSFTSFEDYWAPFAGGQGPAGAYVARLSEADRAALGLRLRQRLLGNGPDRPISLQARAWAVKGVVPQR